MSEKDKKLKKLIGFKKDSSLASFVESQETNERLEAIEEKIANIKPVEKVGVTLDSIPAALLERVQAFSKTESFIEGLIGALKGDKGDKGDKGEDSIVPGPKGEDSIVPGPKGEDSIVPGPKGEDSIVPGPKGEDSIVPGPKGSPDTPEEVAEKLNTLSKALDWGVLKNVPNNLSSKKNGFARGGSSSFKNLDDTPNTFIGSSGLFVKVKSTEDGLEFDTAGSSLTVQDIDGAPTATNVNTIKFTNGSVVDDGSGVVTVTTGAGGGGDVSSNTASSIDSEVVLFSGTGGKTIKRATGSGIATLTSGVLSATATTGTGSVVLASSPTLVTPALGTPASGVMTNATGTASGLTAGTVTTNANLTGVVTSTGNATAIANGAITDAMLANGSVANLSGTNTGDNATNTQYSGLVSNATHTGEVTGSTALTVDKTAITGKTEVTAVGTDYVIISDTSDTGNLKKALVSDFGGGSSAFTGLTDTPASYTGESLKIVRVNAGETALEFVTASGGGDALVANSLAQFASTTSAQLAGVISNETGSGSLVFGTSPTLVTPALGTPTALVGTNITGTGASFTAGNVTTNANLTGHITSTGNSAILGSFTVAQLSTAISDATLSGNNSGDNATNTQYSGLQSNATHTGDATGSTALTVVAINGTSLGGLATGILKNTTTTGVPSIAIAGDFPTLNQNTTGSAATLTTARTIAGVSFNGSANISLNNNAITNGAGYTTNAGTVTSVTSANADATVATTTTTPVVTIVQAPALRSATTTVDVSAATAPTSGQVLTATAGTTATWQTPSGGGNTYFNNENIDQSGGTSDTYGALAGAINGSNTLFTVSEVLYTTGTLTVYLNGQLQTQGSGQDWVETTPASGTFTFAVAPVSGDELLVKYQKNSLSSTVVVTTEEAQTLTNKRIQPRTNSTTTAATLAPSLATANVYYRTTQTETLTISAPIGTPIIGETLSIYVDSVGAETLTINATFKAFGSAFPATTTAGKTFLMVAQFNGTDWKTTHSSAI